MNKKLISLSLIGLMSVINAQPSSSGELTGQCLDAVKSFEEMSNYTYNDPTSSSYRTRNSEQITEMRGKYAARMKTQSQDQCKTAADTNRLSLKQMQEEDRNQKKTQ